jgi:RNA polymerase-binding transcription factor DksA
MDTSKYKARLQEQLKELEGRLANIERDLDEPAEKDWDERAVQLEDDESLEGQAALVNREIASTRRALDRIENGTYGECMQCGGPISEGRLEARPESALCIACAGKG